MELLHQTSKIEVYNMELNFMISSQKANKTWISDDMIFFFVYKPETAYMNIST